MARTYRDQRAFRVKEHGRIEAPIASADNLIFLPNGKPVSKNGEEAWRVGSKRWAKRQASRLRRRHFNREIEYA